MFFLQDARSPDRRYVVKRISKKKVKMTKAASCDFATSSSGVCSESREIDRGGAGTDRPIGIIGW